MKNSKPRQLILSSNQSPGDLLMLSATVRDLHLSHPGEFRTDVRCSHPEIFLHNPRVESVITSKGEWLDMEYPLWETYKDSRACTMHFMHGYRRFLMERLGIDIRPTVLGGEVYLSPKEMEDPGLGPYWILNAGWKDDMPLKRWSPEFMAQVCATFPSLQFLQCGSMMHNHPRVHGDNVVDMRRTSMRKYLSLMYHAQGVITPVSFPMHASVAVPVPPGCPPRACIVLAGGRECDVWEHYTGHSYISAVGRYPCCLEGGCGRRKFEECEDVVYLDIPVAGCMASITPNMVIQEMERFILCRNQ
jgi:ADP-heptose:LPS heptosyltransferase